MKSGISHRTLRLLTFSAYILLAIMTCLLLVHLGHQEVNKAKAFVENEKLHMRQLLMIRKAVDHISISGNEFRMEVSSGNAEKIYEDSRQLRRKVNLLAINDRKRLGQINEDTAMQEEAERLHAITAVIIEDLKAHPFDREDLLEQDLAALFNTIHKLSTRLQIRLSAELDRGDHWLRQTRFFFSRLQYLLTLFFVLTTLFSITAAILFGENLRRALRRLSEGTRQIQAGNLKYRFSNVKGDEIGRLMYDFNLMARRLEQQTAALREANRELAEAHKSKDRFLANMSHELRTPLNAIIGFSELIMRRHQEDPDAKTREQAERILNGAEHLLELISDLLDVAKVDAGVLKPVFSMVSVRDTISRVEQMLHPLAEKQGLELEIAPVSEELYIEADPRLFRQTLINLVNNAVKYTNQGSVKLAVENDSELCRISIIDTGIGISAEEQKLIFQDFHRVEQGLTSNYEGVGLGLTLSKRIVEMHDGRIIVRSKLGKGSSFIIELPIKQKKSKESKS